MSVRRARYLRKNLTDAERKLWLALRAVTHKRGHFRRQVPIGPYIADIAHHRARLIVEVDGGQHNSAGGLRRDAIRDRWFESQGYVVLRFWNNDVLKETNAVASTIADTLVRRLIHMDNHVPTNE